MIELFDDLDSTRPVRAHNDRLPETCCASLQRLEGEAAASLKSFRRTGPWASGVETSDRAIIAESKVIQNGGRNR